jgi:two-component system phosphate regulon response regulator PhoB
MGISRILVIEDERQLATTLEYNLRREGFEAVLAADGEDGLAKAQTILPDLILLDLMLPGIHGLEVCRQIRAGEKTRDIPVIILTARTEELDQVEGFAKGADDYVTKPFSPRVLLQRIKAHLRRRLEPVADTDRIESQGIVIDRISHRAILLGSPLDLTPTEYRLLESMLKQPGRAFTRHELMNASIIENSHVLERTIDVHVKTLRKKLGGLGRLIETVRGVGYRLSETDAE